ncbi:MAG: hypothetical protein ABSF15_22910 [Candidatus Sulfotelmatobacter sp.]
MLNTIEVLSVVADCGSKVTLPVTLWPAAKTKGKVRPVKMKVVPESVA